MTLPDVPPNPLPSPLPSLPPNLLPSLLPNLLIAGAQKGGTTWLHDRIGRHPDIFMSAIKELSFFTGARLKDRLDDYSAHFAAGAGCRWRGESTPGYFWTADPAPDRFGTHYPHRNRGIPGSVRKMLGDDTHILVSLRHPVLRSVSAYMHHYKQGRIDPALPFEEAITRHGIVDASRYSRHSRAWQKAFPDTLKVVFLDDILADGGAVLDDIFAWLGVPPQRIEGADRPYHVGLPLHEVDGAAEVDLAIPNARRSLKKAPATGQPPLRIRQQDLDLLSEILAPEVSWTERRYGVARLGWSTPLTVAALLADHARPAGRGG